MIEPLPATSAATLPSADNRATYPRAHLPILPTLSWGARPAKGSARRQRSWPSVLDAGHALLMSSGTSALVLALRCLGLQPGQSVLLPAYHCPSMFEPVLFLGARPVLVPVREDLSLDLEAAQRSIDRGTRALLAVHYFGFHADMGAARALCNAHGLALVEDCAHAFFGRVDGNPPGATGDFAIASAKKFFPLSDGGCLVSARRSLEDCRLRGAGATSNLKAVLHPLEYAASYGRFAPLDAGVSAAARAASNMASWFKRRRMAAAQVPPREVPAARLRYVDPASIDHRMTAASRFLLYNTSADPIARARRHNYATMAQGFGALKHARALFPSLPEDVVPYMFPLIIDRPERDFPALKRAGVPIWRWEDAMPSDCRVSADYARRLLQLPCHQDLTEHEVRWLVDTVAGVLERG